MSQSCMPGFPSSYTSSILGKLIPGTACRRLSTILEHGIGPFAPIHLVKGFHTAFYAFDDGLRDVLWDFTAGCVTDRPTNRILESG